MDAEKGSFVPVAFFSFLCYNACDSLKEEARITAIESGERITRGLEDGPRRVLSWLELNHGPTRSDLCPSSKTRPPASPGRISTPSSSSAQPGPARRGETDFEGTVTDLQTGAARCAGVSLPQKERSKL